MRFNHHVFICANQKEEGKACCGNTAGMELVERFREVLKERGLQGKVRAQRAGCLDMCKHGPALVVYPSGTFYKEVKLDMIERIVDEHILNGNAIQEWVFEA